MSPVPGSRRARARRLILAKRLVVRTTVGALVGMLLLLLTMLVFEACGAHPSLLGIESLPAFLGGGAVLMNLFPRTRPARLAMRLVRKLADVFGWFG